MVTDRRLALVLHALCPSFLRTLPSLALTVPSLARTVLCLARTVPSLARTVPSLARTVPSPARTVPKPSILQQRDSRRPRQLVLTDGMDGRWGTVGSLFSLYLANYFIIIPKIF